MSHASPILDPSPPRKVVVLTDKSNLTALVDVLCRARDFGGLTNADGQTVLKLTDTLQEEIRLQLARGDSRESDAKSGTLMGSLDLDGDNTVSVFMAAAAVKDRRLRKKRDISARDDEENQTPAISSPPVKRRRTVGPSSAPIAEPTQSDGNGITPVKSSKRKPAPTYVPSPSSPPERPQFLSGQLPISSQGRVQDKFASTQIGSLSPPKIISQSSTPKHDLLARSQAFMKRRLSPRASPVLKASDKERQDSQ